MVTAEIMSTAVHTAHVQESVRDVISRLAECDVRHLPILEGNSLVGMISDRDLREFTSLSLLGHGQSSRTRASSECSHFIDHEFGSDDRLC